MTPSHIIVASLPPFCQNYQNWWKFDEVLTKTNLHSLFRHGVVVKQQTYHFAAAAGDVINRHHQQLNLGRKGTEFLLTWQGCQLVTFAIQV